MWRENKAPKRAGSYLKMWSFPPSPSTSFREVIEKVIRSKKVRVRRGSGVALKGCEIYDMLPMNPEGAEAYVHQGGCSLIFADFR